VNDPTLTLQAAIRTRLLSALSSAGQTAEVVTGGATSLPYIQIGQITVGEWIPNKTATGTEVTHTLVAWSTTATEAQQIAATALQTLTDRANAISLTGYSLSDFRLDFKGGPIEDRETDITIYGVPLRVRYRITQTS
jgi:hypothetical protein